MGLWADYANGVAVQATFAKPKEAEAKNPNDRFAGKREYRTGILNAAFGRIADCDEDGDGRISYDEYVKSHKAAVDNATGHDAPINNDDDFVDFCNKQYNANKEQKEDFKNLDVNGDGFLDKFEIANELNLLDSLSSEDDLPDGTINQRGRERLYGDPQKTSQKIGAMLRRNYENFSKGWEDYFNDYKAVQPNKSNPEVTDEDYDNLSDMRVWDYEKDGEPPEGWFDDGRVYMRSPVSRSRNYSPRIVIPNYRDNCADKKSDIIYNRIIEGVKNIIMEILNILQFIFQR